MVNQEFSAANNLTFLGFGDCKWFKFEFALSFLLTLLV